MSLAEPTESSSEKKMTGLDFNVVFRAYGRSQELSSGCPPPLEGSQVSQNECRLAQPGASIWIMGILKSFPEKSKAHPGTLLAPLQLDALSFQVEQIKAQTRGEIGFCSLLLLFNNSHG